MTVQPGDLAEFALQHGQVRRGDAPDRTRQIRPPGYFSGSSVTTVMRLTPSAATWPPSSARRGAVHRLSAGHGDGVVEQDLVGDVGGGDGGADRQQAGR